VRFRKGEALAVVVAVLATLVGVAFGLRNQSRTAPDTGSPTAGIAPDQTTAAPAGAKPAPVMAHLSEFAIAPDPVTATVGSTIKVMNTGAIEHNLAIEGGRKTAMLKAGGQASLSLKGLTPGTYTMFCQVPGHRQAGMKATLTVTKQLAAASPAAHSMTAEEMDALMARATKAFPAATAGLGAQPLSPTVLADGTKQYDVTTRITKWEVEPGKFVDAWTYNGTVPGPTIHVQPGDKVKFVLHNDLPESTVVHFHGLALPNELDGVPDITQAPVKPGQSYTYSFTAPSEPAVAMYHSHHDAAKQVANGLMGAFLVGELPVPAGVSVAQESTMTLNDTGAIGFSLNGKSFPATAPTVAKLGDWVEVHYMNEGVMAHPMHLHGLTQLVIAKDGFPVPQPYRADTIMVGPGERYSVLVHSTLPGVWAWHCHILPHAERDDGMFGMVTAFIVK
jgi:FtsP/CotA-like multicopper oxidase with cupredoxin domain